ncbi:hypothetical protein B7494_g7690 [Chlorociboria aeruginascens]|nr:hypothetical protein B7494_g7690 [Chlorociboria aeruginascens]
MLRSFIDATVLKAYEMCNGVSKALPNTHSTITATLVLPTSNTGVVLVAPATTNPTTSQTTPTSASQNGTSSATLSTQKMSTAQIAGIAVACVGGVALSVGAVILFICYRKKKKGDKRDSAGLPFQKDPDGSIRTPNSKGFSFGAHDASPPMADFGVLGDWEPGESANGIAARTTPGIPLRTDTQYESDHSRGSQRSDDIGVAIFPNANRERDSQQSYSLRGSQSSRRFSPQKPILKLQVPDSRGESPEEIGKVEPSYTADYTNRQSVATEFEEDDESADTVVNATDSWELGQGNSQTIQQIKANPTEAQNHTGAAFFIKADNGDTWKPGDNITESGAASPEYYVRPLNLTRSVGSFSKPRHPREKLGLEMPLSPKAAALSSYPRTAASSAYSPNLPPSPTRTFNPHPTRQRTQKTYKQMGPYDAYQSGMTAFTAASFETEQWQSPVGTANPDLSPVAESPGQSPVSYPKIPKRVSNTVPVPALPASVFSRPHPPKPPFAHQRQNSSDFMAPSARLGPLSNPDGTPKLGAAPDSRPGSNNSAASALLTKRRGDQASLTLKTEDELKRKQTAKWRVLEKDEIEAAKSTNWRPQLAASVSEYDNGSEAGDSKTPKTPGWMAKLTPTRRGNDLFLSVQQGKDAE